MKNFPFYLKEGTTHLQLEEHGPRPKMGLADSIEPVEFTQPEINCVTFVATTIFQLLF